MESEEMVQLFVQASWLSPRFTPHIAQSVNHFKHLTKKMRKINLVNMERTMISLGKLRKNI
jgi:hypothetical protein